MTETREKPWHWRAAEEFKHKYPHLNIEWDDEENKKTRECSNLRWKAPNSSIWHKVRFVTSRIPIGRKHTANFTLGNSYHTVKRDGVTIDILSGFQKVSSNHSHGLTIETLKMLLTAHELLEKFAPKKA